jgi:hypothetical protein
MDNSRRVYLPLKFGKFAEDFVLCMFYLVIFTVMATGSIILVVVLFRLLVFALFG